MSKRLLFFCGLFFLLDNYLTAQVEIYRSDPSDTATYIAPEDTITKAPRFGSHKDDFYRYLEVRYNYTLSSRYLSFYPEIVRFSFYVERNGSISDLKILYASQMMVGNEIERIVSYMPDWTPGKETGRKKRTLMIYDINIQLTNDPPGIMVNENGLQTEFSNRYKNLKWFLIAGSALIMATLLLTR